MKTILIIVKRKSKVIKVAVCILELNFVKLSLAVKYIKNFYYYILMKKTEKKKDKFIWIFVGVIVVIGVFGISYKYFGGGEGDTINSCEYMSEPLKDEINDLIYDGKNVILQEGEWIHYQEYVVVLNSSDDAVLLKLASIKNQSSGYSSDFCKFTEVLSGDTYETVFVSDGKGFLSIGGINYGITMVGEHVLPSEEYKVKIDFPQTSGDDIFSFENCICDAVTNYCVLNMLGDAESTGQIQLGVSVRSWHPIEVTSGIEECNFIGKNCFLGFGGIVYPDTEYFNYDNMGLISCNEIFDLEEMQSSGDWVDGSKVLVSYLCVNRSVG